MEALKMQQIFALNFCSAKSIEKNRKNLKFLFPFRVVESRKNRPAKKTIEKRVNKTTFISRINEIEIALHRVHFLGTIS
jgi:hypothetical protein